MKTLFHLLENSLSKYHNLPIFHTNTNSTITYEKFMKNVRKFEYVLQTNNIKKGDKCIVIGNNSPTLGALYHAMFRNGAIVVPTYSNQQENVKVHMINETKPKIVFNTGNSLSSKFSQHKFHEINHETSQINNQHFLYKYIDIDEQDLAAILYTSGTSGLPKGVKLTHLNIMSNIESIDRSIGNNNWNITKDDKSVMFLPFNHSYGLSGFNYMIKKGASMYINNDPTQLINDFKTYNPTLLFAVPRLFQMIYQKLPIQNMDYVPYIFKYLLTKQLFGSELKYATCGGAFLDPKLLQTFHNLNVPIFQGYGTTEASPMIALNNGKNNKYKSVGKILDCNKVKFVNDEIWVSGNNVSSGYYNIDSDSFVTEEEKTWYKTGDTGYIENEYLYITGRISETYKLSNGKFVNPSEVENILCRSSKIKQCMVYTLNGIDNEVLVATDYSKQEIEETIKQLENQMKGYDVPKKVRIVDQFDPKFMTQKQSLKRNEILKEYVK